MQGLPRGGARRLLREGVGGGPVGVGVEDAVEVGLELGGLEGPRLLVLGVGAVGRVGPTVGVVE